MTMTIDPAKPIRNGAGRYERAPVADMTPDVNATGGKWRAGYINNVSLIARGEALGHGEWVDETALDQVVELANRPNQGVKSRFAHPSMSNDGIGRHLGRVRDAYRNGDKVVGDLHFQQSATKTPDGNLRDYVVELAREDPAAAGLSIAFQYDFESMVEFHVDHGAVMNGDGMLDLTNFVSPDNDNTENLPHIRVGELRAADVVDEPAANPDGLFDRVGIARDADAWLAYATGQSEETPAAMFGIDADRGRDFVQRWLASHELTIANLGGDVVETKPAEAETVADVAPAETAELSTDVETSETTRDALMAELNRYTETFGAENGAKWFREGKTWDGALAAHVDHLNARIQGLETELAASNDKLAAVDLGEESEALAVATAAPEPKSVFHFIGDESPN